MAIIAGVDVGRVAYPEEDRRMQKRTWGKAFDGSTKFYYFRSSDREIPILLESKSTSLKNQLAIALESDADRIVTIQPDSHIDYGNGPGNPVNAFWVDDAFHATKTKHERWNIRLLFLKV